MTASRSPTVLIGCDDPGCLAFTRSKPGETETELRKFLRTQGWVTAVQEGALLADYCPVHPPATGDGAA